jgi:outer membrane protein assembly factor BamB
MKRIYMYGAALLVCIFYSFSCGKEEVLITKDASGVVTGRPHIWAVPTTDDGQKCATYFVTTEVSYDNDILISARKNNQKIARMLNLSNGSTKWEWSDFIEQRDYFNIKNPCYQNKDLIWQADYWNFRIDLSDGKTKWKNAFPQHNGTYALDLQDKYACVNNYNKDSSIPIDSGGVISIISKSDGLVSSKITLSYDTLGTLPFSESQRLGVVAFLNTWNYQSDLMILVTYGDPPLKGWLFRNYIGLYNYTKKVWVYTKVLLTEPTQWGASNIPVIVNNKIYHTANHKVICHDILTGAKKWETDVGSGKGFIFSPLMVAENRLYANSDNGFLHCINLETGDVIWEIRTSGSSTKLGYLNGIIYFVGGGDGKLHAIEATTGNYLWKLESLDKSKDKWAVFTGLCAVIRSKNGEKGKIVVMTGLNAYCYEAER